MSLKLQRQVDDLKKRLDAANRKIAGLERDNKWIRREMQNGLRDIIERVVRETIEINVEEQSADEQIMELIK